MDHKAHEHRPEPPIVTPHSCELTPNSLKTCIFAKGPRAKQVDDHPDKAPGQQQLQLGGLPRPQLLSYTHLLWVIVILHCHQRSRAN